MSNQEALEAKIEILKWVLAIIYDFSPTVNELEEIVKTRLKALEEKKQGIDQI